MGDEDPKAKDTIEADVTPDDESSDDDALAAAVTADEPAKADDDTDFYESDEAFLKSYHERGLPDTIKSVEDAVDYALKAAEQAKTGSDDSATMDRLNQFLANQGHVGGVDALLAGGTLPVAKPADDRKEFIPSAPAMDFVERQIRDGRIKAEDQGYFRNQAEMTDASLKLTLEPIQQVLAFFADRFESHGKIIKEMEWQTMPRRFKENIKRHELDALINAKRAGSYMEAFNKLALSARPDLLRVIADGTKPGRDRSGALKKPKRRPISKPYDWSRYVNEDGSLDQEQLRKLDPDTRMKVLKKIGEDIKKE